MSQSSSSVSGQPVENHRNKLCNCGLTVREYTSSKPQSLGLRFICCPKKKEDQCLFFEWVDPLVYMRCAGTILSLEDRVRENEKTIGALEARILDLLVSERLLQVNVREHESRQSELQAAVLQYGDRLRAAEIRTNCFRKRLKVAYFVVTVLFVALLSLFMAQHEDVASSSLLRLEP